LIDKDYEAEKAAVEARPYRYAELQGSEPTPAAKKIRDDEIDYLYTLKELHKVAIFKQIRGSMLSSIKALYDEYCSCIATVDGKAFEMVLDDETISNITTTFDSVNVIWTVEIVLKNIEGLADTDFSFSLSYKQLTGQEVQEPKYRGQQGYDEYMEYLDNIDYLDTVVKAFADSFRITLSFTGLIKQEDQGITFSGIGFSNIRFELETNALSDSNWALVVPSQPNSVINKDLVWNLPGYSKTFEMEFAK
jgi:hypothetical protein